MKSASLIVLIATFISCLPTQPQEITKSLESIQKNTLWDRLVSNPLIATKGARSALPFQKKVAKADLSAQQLTSAATSKSKDSVTIYQRPQRPPSDLSTTTQQELENAFAMRHYYITLKFELLSRKGRVEPILIDDVDDQIEFWKSEIPRLFKIFNSLKSN